MVTSLLLAMVTTTAVSWWVTKLVAKKGKDWKIMDDPQTHKHPKVTHATAVPRGGGIPIIAAMTVGFLLWMPKDIRTLGILIGGLILAWAGWVDDRHEEKFSPYLRIGVNAAVALAVIGSGIGIAFINSPLGGIIDLSWPRWCIGNHCIWVLSDLFAMIWLIWMQNIVGWSSGVDGQLPGFVIIAAVVMALLGMRFPADTTQTRVIILAGITAGAFAGFLPWNWFPQKIMPGYGGKSLAGYLLGVLAILSVAKVGTLIMVLGLPMIDAVWVIVKRIREKRSPVWGGREHLHHYLLDRGWGKQKIAIFYSGMSAILGLLAWRLKPPWKSYTMAVALLILSGIILWLQSWSISSKQPDPGNG